MKKHVTIRDIAQLTGFSTKTVSRVVNEQGEISAETRQKVKEAIELLGYFPNITARNLVKGRSNTIAVVAWGIEYYGPSRVLVGIEQQADKLGYSLLLTLLRAKEMDKIRETLRSLAARRVDGIIFAIPEFNHNRDWITDTILQQLPPMVFLNMANREGLNIIAVNNKLGASVACQHLVDLGRKNIGIICGPLNWWEARQRLEGWKEVMLNENFPLEPSIIIEGDWSAESGEKAMVQLLKNAPNIDAVFVCNDQMALGALGVLHRLGKRIPEDVAVVGFDDIPDSAYFYPSLTTIHQPLIELGNVGVHILEQKINAMNNDRKDKLDDGKLEHSITTLSPHLIVRESTHIDKRKN